MKQNILYIVLSLFLFVGCQQEEVQTEAQGIGYLVLDEVQAVVPELATVASRTVDNDLYVKITGDGVNLTYVPGNFPTEKIALATGAYEIEIYNAAYDTKQSNAAKYYLKSDFTIEEGKVNYSSFQVPMVNFAVSFVLPEGFDTLFGNVSFTVQSSSTASEAVTLAEDSVVYFDYTEDVSISYTLKATNADDEEVTDEGTYSSIEAGKQYVVTYALPEAALRITAL